MQIRVFKGFEVDFDIYVGMGKGYFSKKGLFIDRSARCINSSGRKGRYLRGDKLRIWPSLILMRPAAEIRDPCRKEECWKAPDCLIPM